MLFKECSHYCELVSGSNQMPRTLEIAIREAVGKRGVSVVVIPGDVALLPASDAPPPKLAGLLPPQPVMVPSATDLDQLAAMLNGDGRVNPLDFRLPADGVSEAVEAVADDSVYSLNPCGRENLSTLICNCLDHWLSSYLPAAV